MPFRLILILLLAISTIQAHCLLILLNPVTFANLESVSKLQGTFRDFEKLKTTIFFVKATKYLK